MKHLLLLYLGIGLLFFSCSDDEDPTPSSGKYSNGVWVLNEGNFGTPNGTLGFFSFDSSRYVPDVYARENSGIPTGDVLQSMILHNGIIYIVANNDNRIIRIKASSGKALSNWEFPELNSPRSIEISGNDVFISNWGPFDSNFELKESFILKTDLNGSSVTKYFCGTGPEGIRMVDGDLLVTNSFSNTLEVMEPGNGSITSTINVGEGPTDIEEDINGDIWVICTGRFITNGSLVKMNPTYAVDSVFAFGAGSGSQLVARPDNDRFNFYAGNAVWNVDPQSLNLSTAITGATTNGIYGIGAISGDQIWVGDHNNFTGNGTVFRYGVAGIGGTFTAGVLPKQFIEVN